MTSVTMPFSKHHGRPFDEILSSYLLWVLDNCDIQPSLRRAVELVVCGGDDQDTLRDAYDRGYLAGFALAREQYRHGPALDDVRERANRWHRNASLKCHPDRGGNVVVMQVLNELKDTVFEAVGIGRG